MLANKLLHGGEFVGAETSAYNKASVFKNSEKKHEIGNSWYQSLPVRSGESPLFLFFKHSDETIKKLQIDL